MDSWIYDRVEAIGGPSSFLFGSGAVGGSINYITKTPERTDFTEAQVRAGSHRLRKCPSASTAAWALRPQPRAVAPHTTHDWTEPP